MGSTYPSSGQLLEMAGEAQGFQECFARLPAPETGPGAEVHLTAIASFSESSFLPIGPWAQGTGWVGSCLVLPHHAISGLDHRSSQGWVPEALGQRVPLPLPPNQVFGGGIPKPFWKGLQRKV